MLKRFILSVLGLIVLAIIAAAVALAVTWSGIPDIIATKLSEKMKVSVDIEDMHLGWDAIAIDKVEIGNPPGSILHKAFSADQILIEAPITNYLDKNIVIDEIDVSNVYVGLEFESKGSKKGNWTTIMGNMQGDKNAKKAKGGKTVLIKKLILTNISIALAYRQGGGPVKNLAPIKRLEFDNVTSEEGIPTEQISNIIFQQMLKEIFSIENLQNMLQDVLPQSSPIQQGINVFKGLFGTDATEVSP